MYHGLVMPNLQSEKDQPSNAPPPLSDEEFNAWWPFSDDDLDGYEREIEKSLEGYEILPDPNWHENKRRIEEMARRTLSQKYPGRMTEDQKRRLPPGLLAYWLGEAPTPYADPTGWDEFRKTLTPSDDLWRLIPTDENTETEHQGPPPASDSAA